nr:PREDICTED: exosome complex component RRP43-like [Bemisia tabaci]
MTSTNSQYKTIHPVRYYREYLSHNIRPDGRSLQQFRPISINIGSLKNADGSAVIKLGNTSVVCGVKAELFTPKAEEPDVGCVVVNVELPPMCSGKVRPGPPSDQAQLVSSFINELVMKSDIVDLKQLCIVPTKLAWVLFCDIICLNNDGGLTDACVTALVGALKSVHLPEASYEADVSKTNIDIEKKHPLTGIKNIAATTFAIFDDEILLADPNDEEEEISSGILTIVTDSQQLFSVHKPGGCPLSDEITQKCLKKSKDRAVQINELISSCEKKAE